MADTSPKKKVVAKPKKPAAHPKYSEMVGKAKRKRRVFQTSHPEVYYGQLQCWKRRQDCKCTS